MVGEEDGGRKKRPNDKEKWGQHVRWQAATSNQEAPMGTVAVETRDRVNEAVRAELTEGEDSGGSMRECFLWTTNWTRTRSGMLTAGKGQ